MIFAKVGFLTVAMESTAAAVGAGILLGGFVTGVVGLVLAWPQREVEERLVCNGYIGGIAGIGTVVADIIFRYAI